MIDPRASARAKRNAAAICLIPADGRQDGTIPCPSCRRPLHYRYLAVGLKAYCETPDCTGFAT